MSTTKATKDSVPARPERTRVTHPVQPGPHEEPFSEKVREILSALGEDPGREGLLKTPERVEKSMRFLTQGYWMTVEGVVGDAVFEEAHQSMIMVRDIEVYSLCEHHLLPLFGRAHVAYIPDGKILGLSKVARIVDVFARRLQVQERLTDQIADAVMEILQPTGVGVVLTAAHFCMMMRGVEKQNSVMTTSCLLGSFKEDARTRSEFLALLKQ